jgi:HEAT repeat protein
MTNGPVPGVPSDPITLVTVGVLVLTVLAIVSCVLLVMHHAVSELRQRRRDRRIQDAMVLLAPAIVVARDLPEVALSAVARFGRKPVSEVLRRARGEMAGEPAVALTAALESMGEVKRLVRCSRSRSTARRRTAVRQLAECGGDAASDALVKALDDLNWEVRRAARDGLLADGREEPIRLALESYMCEPTKVLGWRRAFYARFATVAPVHLCSLLQGGSLESEEEKLAIEALGHARATQAAAEVRLRLHSQDAELRASAARFAGKVDDRESVDDLTCLLRDPEWFVRAAAARGLERLPKSNQALVALGDCLEDGTWWVRANAARTLARDGERGHRILLDAMEREDAYARDAAIAALAIARIAALRQGTTGLETHTC